MWSTQHSSVINFRITVVGSPKWSKVGAHLKKVSEFQINFNIHLETRYSELSPVQCNHIIDRLESILSSRKYFGGIRTPKEKGKSMPINFILKASVKSSTCPFKKTSPDPWSTPFKQVSPSYRSFMYLYWLVCFGKRSWIIETIHFSIWFAQSFKIFLGLGGDT